jgi:hypothetical protein
MIYLNVETTFIIGWKVVFLAKKDVSLGQEKGVTEDFSEDDEREFWALLRVVEVEHNGPLRHTRSCRVQTICSVNISS